MRNAVATFAVAVLALTVAAPLAAAAPTQVNVRIEGKAETLFEGPILTDVHRVKASSDTKWRRCDGVNVNAPLNKVPGVVPTAAGSDAMRIASLDFDAQWYNQYEDYFLKRWGPDAQDVGENEYWGILVNNVFTAVGGCQYQLDGGDEVLWIYDAFDGRERLALYPAGYSGGATPLTATATLNQPFAVEVDTWEGYNEGSPPPTPTRTTTPYEGAEVAPVITNGQGFQKVDTASAATVVSGADGKASVTFTTSGWHRIKATDVGVGEDAAIRSNRLDVCVPEPPATDCGPLRADAQVRTPPPPVAGEVDGEGGEEQPGGEQPGGGGAGAGSSPAPGPSALPAGPPAPRPGQVRLQHPGLDRSRLARGLVGVSWKVLDPGSGISRWTIASRTLGRKGARWIDRASGSGGTAATLRLPRGAGYRLRLSVVDALGRVATAPLGRVQVPR
ncbi:MAG TPA: DUF4430 domain-containing protein [Solirubrobacterales bacterium]|nr:DUF4430 domain-containing protein [Solirubrobacterales bacterium]